MYYEHFGLKQNPFLLDTDAQCVFYGGSQCDAVAHLLYGMRESRVSFCCCASLNR